MGVQHEVCFMGLQHEVCFMGVQHEVYFVRSTASNKEYSYRTPTVSLGWTFVVLILWENS